MTNKEIIEKKGVFIERAEPLTSEGIKAICMSDEDYDKYKAIQIALSLQKEEFEKMIEELKRHIEVNGNLSNRIVENEEGEFEHKHDYVLNNIVLELIDEELLTKIKEMKK